MKEFNQWIDLPKLFHEYINIHPVLIFIMYTQVFKIFRLSKEFCLWDNMRILRTQWATVHKEPDYTFDFIYDQLSLLLRDLSLRASIAVHPRFAILTRSIKLNSWQFIEPRRNFISFLSPSRFLPLFFQLAWHGVSTLKSSVNDICFRSTAQCETFHTSFFDFFNSIKNESSEEWKTLASLDDIVWKGSPIYLLAR